MFAAEAERNRKAAGHPCAMATVAGVDTLNWKLIRILLSATEPVGNEAGDAYQILHLARPLLDRFTSQECENYSRHCGFTQPGP